MKQGGAEGCTTVGGGGEMAPFSRHDLARSSPFSCAEAHRARTDRPQQPQQPVIQREGGARRERGGIGCAGGCAP